MNKKKSDVGTSAWLSPEGRALQPIEILDDRVARFKSNAIVKLLLHDGNYEVGEN